MPPTPVPSIDGPTTSTMQQQQLQPQQPNPAQNNSETNNSYGPNSTEQLTDFSSPLTTEEQMQNDAFDDIFNGLGGDYLGFFKHLGHLAEIQDTF